MNSLAMVICGLALGGLHGTGTDAERTQEARSRLASLPHLTQTTWKQLLTKQGWLYGSMSAKIKIIGVLTSNANEAAKNVLFGSPMHKGDLVCKTILVPDANDQVWNTAAKLRIAYGLSEPNRYKVPSIKLDAQKHVVEAKTGALDAEWKALPDPLKQRATEEFLANAELAKNFKVDTYYVLLPNSEVVEVGHPLNIEKVWNDYLSSK